MSDFILYKGEKIIKVFNGHVSFDECRLFRYDLLRVVKRWPLII